MDDGIFPAVLRGLLPPFGGALLGAALLLAVAGASLAAPRIAPAEENAIIHVHDPDAVKEGRYTYVFSTGPGVMIRRSKDLLHWTYVGRVFPKEIPQWAADAVPGADREFIWAPGIAFFNGMFHCYYSISTFGSNRSVIGLAVSRTLDPDSPKYGWQDRGLVVESQKGGSYNAIDAEAVLTGEKSVSLVFGSWWSGIKIIDLDYATGKPPAGAVLKSLAERPNWAGTEAPFIFRAGRWYYLLTSWDLCCRGVDSTYNIRIGRSGSAAGPYVDKDGKPLMQGGGTLLLGTEGRWVGPGHCSVLQDGKRRYLVFHAYDRENKGTPTLRIRPLEIGKDGWPVLAPALFEPPAPEKTAGLALSQ